MLKEEKSNGDFETVIEIINAKEDISKNYVKK